MKLLRHISENEVSVPRINDMVRYLIGGMAFLICTVLILIHEASTLRHPMGLLVLTSLSAAVGVACFSWRSVVHINRTTGTMTRQWGFFISGSDTIETIDPHAVVLLSRQREGDEDGAEHYAVLLARRKGHTIIRESWCLEAARQLAEELAEFLDVELCEDRLIAPTGWLQPLKGVALDTHSDLSHS